MQQVPTLTVPVLTLFNSLSQLLIKLQVLLLTASKTVIQLS